MNSTGAVLLACVCLAAQAVAFEVSAGGCPKKGNTVKPFAPERYVGKWYEIERYAQIWEVLGKCSTALYELNENVSGRVNVTNTLKTIIGTEISQGGYADITSTDGSAELNVVFQVPLFGKREAPYWVLDTDYDNYSLVYSCSDLWGLAKLESAWILGRDPTLDEVSRANVDAAVEYNKLNKRAFKPTKQDCWN